MLAGAVFSRRADVLMNINNTCTGPYVRKSIC